ncbi:hypothetical protein NGRA_2264, partial [Nosema granulosis]
MKGKENILKKNIHKQKQGENMIESEVSANTFPQVTDAKQDTIPPTLKALLTELDIPQTEWPKEMLKRVILIFGRMPRNGWKLASDTFSEKFKQNISLTDFKKRASNGITNLAGNKCSQMKFKEESGKRIKTLESMFDDKSLYDSKLYMKVKNSFSSIYKEIKDKNIIDVERTPKIATEYVDYQVLDLINKTLEEYLSCCDILPMSKIA